MSEWADAIASLFIFIAGITVGVIFHQQIIGWMLP